jgi:hypothetical protein
MKKDKITYYYSIYHISKKCETPDCWTSPNYWRTIRRLREKVGYCCLLHDQYVNKNDWQNTDFYENNKSVLSKLIRRLFMDDKIDIHFNYCKIIIIRSKNIEELWKWHVEDGELRRFKK